MPLSQAWQDYLEKPAPSPSAPSPAPSAPTPAPAAPPTATAAAPAAPAQSALFGSPIADMPAASAMDVANLAATQGMGQVLNAPNYLAGAPRTVDVTTLTPEQQAGLAAHPWAAWAGRTIGQTIGTLPAMMLPEGAAALVGGTRAAGAVSGLMANPLVGGAVQGAATNLLTGAENPDESIARRALVGAGTGLLGGAIGNRVAGWFGGNVAIPQSVADAGGLLKSQGIDLTEHNLPGATGGFVSTKTMGAPPTDAQAAQIAQAVTSKFLPPNAPAMTNLGPDNLTTLLDTTGQRITTAANSGGINLTSAPGLPGALRGVIAASQDPVNMLTPTEQRAVAAQTGRIIDAINAGGGKLSGQQFDGLVGHNSTISGWVNPGVNSTQSAGMSQVAGQLDDALRNAFRASSPADAYGNWVNARTDYRLLKGIEGSIDPGGDLNPTTLWTNIKQKFPDVRTLPQGAANQVGNMAQLADALRTAFGGPMPNVAAQQSWFARHPLLTGAAGIAGVGGGAAGLANVVMNPAATLGAGSAYALEHLPTIAGLGGLGAAGLIGRGLGAAYQASPLFMRNLLATGRGGSPIVNALAPYAAVPATVALPAPQRAPTR